MAHIPPHVRARIISLGALSRPLGEDRAVAFALELTRSIAAEIARSGDPERPLVVFESRLRRELAANDRRAAASRGGEPSPIALHEILPEFPRPW